MSLSAVPRFCPPAMLAVPPTDASPQENPSSSSWLSMVRPSAAPSSYRGPPGGQEVPHIFKMQPRGLCVCRSWRLRASRSCCVTSDLSQSSSPTISLAFLTRSNTRPLIASARRASSLHAARMRSAPTRWFTTSSTMPASSAPTRTSAPQRHRLGELCQRPTYAAMFLPSTT